MNPCSDSPLLWAAMFRIATSGMHGDMALLESLVSQIYYDNLQASAIDIELVSAPVSIPSIPLYDAIDFHVCPTIMSGFDFDENYVKDMMWKNASSFNVRKPNEILANHDWKSIQQRILRKQQYHYSKWLA